ncbi:MAG: DUF58 domain-containing protein [Treponemataceae bacterium]|nr:DUF58 domain-containing protein [Treponemataceae bacterium]
MRILDENRGRLARRAQQLRLNARTVADSLRQGAFRSVSRGQGIDFSGVREYLSGDNVRSIDWNVTARMGKPFVKQYEEDRELHVLFVLDRSASMLTGSAGRARLAAASEAAAVLLFAAEQNACAVGAVFFDGAIQWACVPKAGRAQVMALFSRLDRLDDGGVRGSALASALNGAGTLLKRRSLVFVLSDFRADGWLQPLARLSGKHDVVAVRVTDPCDTELPAVGTVPFADGETGARRMLPTSSVSFRRAWFEDNRQRTDFWQGECLRHGAYPLALSTADDAVQVLSRFFSQRLR